MFYGGNRKLIQKRRKYVPTHFTITKPEKYSTNKEN